ncbi:MAG: hypothetical protein JRJ85_19865 [Deltaproteobacteria bacterium]|nr:hypothetical protein [Deltaproteobacteria bacterium]
MNENNGVIEALKKVMLSFQSGNSPEDMNILREPVTEAFIFGIGTGGLTPFEYQLVGKKEGDTLAIHVEGQNMAGTFQHLFFPSLGISEASAPVYLKIKVVKVMKADQREVIGAMAENAGCSGHCCGH